MNLRCNQCQWFVKDGTLGRCVVNPIPRRGICLGCKQGRPADRLAT